MNITEFPDEIIDQILNYIPKEYKNTSIICKQWNYVQSKKYFQTECNECNILNNAIKRDHERCLLYILKHEDKENIDINYIAKNGNINCLRYAHEKGCLWNIKTCKDIAFSGHLNCLKYAHENGCPWDKRTCESAIRTVHLDCLEYAHENGCPR